MRTFGVVFWLFPSKISCSLFIHQLVLHLLQPPVDSKMLQVAKQAVDDPCGAVGVVARCLAIKAPFRKFLVET